VVDMHLWMDAEQVDPRSIGKISWNGTGLRARLTWLGDGTGDGNNRLDQDRQASCDVTLRRCIAFRKSSPETSSSGDCTSCISRFASQCVDLSYREQPLRNVSTVLRRSNSAFRLGC
jgi:hypothetical protein